MSVEWPAEAILSDDQMTSPGRRLETILICTLGALALAQFATWLPNYLCRPYWADQDVFATMAQGWRHGQLPYRDLKSNQFPGEFYLFAALDRTFGVSRPIVFYAADAAGVVLLGAGLVLWGRRCFSSSLPGLIGLLTFLGYYFGLDHSEAAQRDWHAALLAVLGLMAAEAAPRRLSRMSSAVLVGLACAIRPQAVLFVPAHLVAVARRTRRFAGAPARPGRAFLRWGATFVAVLVLAFVPLMWMGAWRYFLEGLRMVRYGASYNDVGLVSVTRVRWFLAQITDLSILIVPLLVAVLTTGRGPSLRGRWSCWAWLVAFAGAALYKPLSPRSLAYLDAPLILVRAVLVAALAGLIREVSGVRSDVRLTAVLLTLCLGAQLRPKYSSPASVAHSFEAIVKGKPVATVPYGTKFFASSNGLDQPVTGIKVEINYSWSDYQDLLTFLRDQVPRSVPIANLLPFEPGLVSVTLHPSLLPAESSGWLKVNPADEGAFIAAIERAQPGLVIWSPELDILAGDQEIYQHDFLWPSIKAVVREHFELLRKFGPFEVWQRVTPAH